MGQEREKLVTKTQGCLLEMMAPGGSQSPFLSAWLPAPSVSLLGHKVGLSYPFSLSQMDKNKSSSCERPAWVSLSQSKKLPWWNSIRLWSSVCGQGNETETHGAHSPPSICMLCTLIVEERWEVEKWENLLRRRVVGTGLITPPRFHTACVVVIRSLLVYWASPVIKGHMTCRHWEQSLPSRSW